MKPDHSNKVAKKIESICEQGCSEVDNFLKKSVNSDDIKELSEFSKTEIKQIIDELNEIMSVYDIDDNVDKDAEKRDE